MPKPRLPDFAERQALRTVLEKAVWDDAAKRWTLQLADAQYRAVLEMMGGYVEPEVKGA